MCATDFVELAPFTPFSSVDVRTEVAQPLQRYVIMSKHGLFLGDRPALGNTPELGARDNLPR